MTERITRYMENGAGGRTFELRLNGVRVCVVADFKDQVSQAEANAQLIADLGPENLPSTPTRQVSYVPPVTATDKPVTRKRWTVGDRVRCNVFGAQADHTVLDVRPRDGYIKINGSRSWCPPYNFDAI